MRERTKYRNDSEVAHAWAHKEKDYCKSYTGRVFSERDTIYSYGHHWAIAKHVTNSKGENAVLYNDRTYSRATTKHHSIVRSAINHLNIIRCPFPDGNLNDNVQRWISRIREELSSLSVARKPEKYINNILGIKNGVEKYCDFMGYDFPPEIQKYIDLVGNSYDIEKYNDLLAQERKRAEELEFKRLKAKMAEYKKNLTKWLNFEKHYLYGRVDGRDYLRFNKETNRIETSQCLEIPLCFAEKLWKSIKAGEIAVNDQFMKWNVLEVGKNIKIGCHTFPTKYLIEFGNQIFAK